MITAPALAERLAAVDARIAEACDRSGRDPRDIRLVAVTKGMDAGVVAAAAECGLVDIGENRVQEAEAKAADLAVPVRWHLIGHLQSNKAARAAALFDAVHSVDGVAIAQAIAEHRAYDADPVALLVQVDYTGSATRSGAPEDDVAGIVRELAGAGGIHVIGLMTIAAPGDLAVARETFARLRDLRDRTEEATGWALPELSMGMTDDFEVAIEEGATMVRLGRVLFGER